MANLKLLYGTLVSLICCFLSQVVVAKAPPSRFGPRQELLTRPRLLLGPGLSSAGRPLPL